MSDTKTGNRRSALALYCIAAVGLPAVSLLSALLEPLLEKTGTYWSLLISDCLYYLPFIALPVFLYTRNKPEVRQRMRPDGINPGRLILICLLAFNLFILCNDITVLWAIPFQKLGLNIYAGSYPTPANPGDLVLYTLSAAALPAICEEFLFRGILLSTFEAGGTKRAIVLTAVMFALLHGSPLGFPAEFIAGIVIACVTLTSDSVYAGMILHTLYNAITIVIDYMQQSTASGDLITNIGGSSGVLTLVCDCVLFIACVSFLIRAMFFRAEKEGQLTVIKGAQHEKLCRIEYIFLGIACAAILLLYVLSILTML